jgi:hypothetical protein
VHGALGHHRAPPGEQLPGLDRRQAVIDQPPLQQVVIGHQQAPGGPTTLGAVRTHLLADRAQQLVAQLALAAVADHARLDRCGDIATHRLAVHPHQPLDRAQPLTTHPQAQHLTDLVHTNLPEHDHLPDGRSPAEGGKSTGSSTAAGGCPGGGPITGGAVVPSSWRNSPQGGPMLLAGDSPPRT